MKTPEEVALELATETLAKLGVGRNTRTLNIVWETLKKQDKMTRHACAESVISLSGTDAYDDGGVLIQTSKAYKAIINTKAV